MKLPFGIEIIRKKPAGKNSLIANLLYPWSYGRELSHESNYDAFMNAYRGWVYVAASKNATSAASVPIRLYAGKPNNAPIKSHKNKKISPEKDYMLRNSASVGVLKQVRTAAEIVEIQEHPILEMMRNVNNFMNYFALFELTNLFQELCGNAYWYILRDRLNIPREIWPIPPQYLRVIPDKTNFISGYKFKVGMREVFFKEGDVIHFKFPSPTSLYYGRGPLAAVTDAYNISQSINRYEGFVFQNMGRIEGAFETENELSQYEFDRLKEEIRKTFTGVENVGKSPLLEKGVKYRPYGLAPKDLSFMQGRKAVKEEIVNAFGQSLGLYDKDATRANAEVASFTHMKDTIKPRLVRTEQKLNEKLTPQFDQRLFLAFDDPVPVDKEFRLKEVETHLKTSYSGINEEREKDNLPPVEWGDIPIINTNMAPLGSRQEEPSQPSGDDLPELDDDAIYPVSKFIADGINDFSKEIASSVIKKIGA
jgi:HK97 family phage portal protein